MTVVRDADSFFPVCAESFGKTTMKNETKDLMSSGELYYPGDPEILREQQRYQDQLAVFNRTLPSEADKREKMLHAMLAECGDGSWIEAPFYSNFGGHNCHLGRNVYVNYACTFVDDTDIYIGNYTMLGPGVVLASAAHPAAPSLRRQGAQYNLPVRIGENCWLGAGVIVLPGVTIGDNTIVGAGSVVTKDLPADVIAVGNPCRVMRSLGDADLSTYDHGKRQIKWDEWAE